MQSRATSVEQYLAELPEDRRRELETVRAVVRAHLDAGFEEGMQYGMIGYYVPHRLYPAGYHCDPRQPLPFAALAAQKHGISVYLMPLYADAGELKRFQESWKRSGKTLDMGKSCVRFERAEDACLDAIGEAIGRFTPDRYIAVYEAMLPPAKRPTPDAAGAEPRSTARMAVSRSVPKSPKRPG
jgi:hypothetical protein